MRAQRLRIARKKRVNALRLRRQAALKKANIVRQAALKKAKTLRLSRAKAVAAKRAHALRLRRARALRLRRSKDTASKGGASSKWARYVKRVTPKYRQSMMKLIAFFRFKKSRMYSKAVRQIVRGKNIKYWYKFWGRTSRSSAYKRWWVTARKSWTSSIRTSSKKTLFRVIGLSS